jgi:hypothetical protein
MGIQPLTDPVIRTVCRGGATQTTPKGYLQVITQPVRRYDHKSETTDDYRNPC